VDQDVVVKVELMNERGESWPVVGSGATVDAAVAVVEAWANSNSDHAVGEYTWVMNDWQAL
jgi:hypothetical protein